MNRRVLALVVPLPLLCALGAWGSVTLADRVGSALGRALAAFADFVVKTERPEGNVEEGGGDIADGATVPVALATPAEAPRAPGRAGRKATKNPQKKAEPVLFVSASTVLKLAESRARPRGVAVKAEGARPAGLRLSNVAALGIGLRDGDVLTRAVGQPALSSGAVVQAVLVARSRRATMLEGEFWRAGERWVIRVEQPYPAGS